MTAQDYRLQTSVAAAHSAATVMALMAVGALGLMGFAMGYTKADHASLNARSASVHASGVEQAMVSPVMSGQNDLYVTTMAPNAAEPAPLVRAKATTTSEMVAPPAASVEPVVEPVVATEVSTTSPPATPEAPAAA